MLILIFYTYFFCRNSFLIACVLIIYCSFCSFCCSLSAATFPHRGQQEISHLTSSCFITHYISKTFDYFGYSNCNWHVYYCSDGSEQRPWSLFVTMTNNCSRYAFSIIWHRPLMFYVFFSFFFLACTGILQQLTGCFALNQDQP